MIRPHIMWSLLTFQSHPLSQWSGCLRTCQVWAPLWLCTYSSLKLKIFPWLLVLQVSAHTLCRGTFLDHTVYLVLFVACTANLICLFLPCFHPRLTPQPCHHRMCGQEAGSCHLPRCPVPPVQYLGGIPYRRMKKTYSFSLMLIASYHKSP